MLCHSSCSEFRRHPPFPAPAPAPASAVFRLPRFGGAGSHSDLGRSPARLPAGSQASHHCIGGHADPSTRPISCFETSADPSIPPSPHPMSGFETSKSRPRVRATARRIRTADDANHARKHSAPLRIPPRRPNAQATGRRGGYHGREGRHNESPTVSGPEALGIRRV